MVQADFSLPRGSYPTPFLGRLLFKITDRYPKKGVGYEPLGRVQKFFEELRRVFVESEVWGGQGS